MMTPWLRSFLSVLTAWACFAAGDASAELVFETRDFSTRQLDLSGTRLGGPGQITINNHGQVAFLTTLRNSNDPNINGRRAIFSEAASPLGVPTEIARVGAVATDLQDGRVYQRLDNPIITDVGVTGFLTTIEDPNAPTDPGNTPIGGGPRPVNSFFATTTGNPGQARAGLVPGETLTMTPDNAVATFSPVLVPGLVALGNNGEFVANTPATGGAAIFAGPTPGGDRIVARRFENDPTGNPYEVLDRVAINGHGEVAYTAFALGSSFTTNLYSEAAGSVGNPAVIERTGRAVPELGPNATLGALQKPVFNNAGQHAFLGRVSGLAPDDKGVTVQSALFSQTVTGDGSFGVILREDAPVPGKPDNFEITSFRATDGRTDIMIGGGGHVLLVNPEVVVTFPNGAGLPKTNGLFLQGPNPGDPLKTVFLNQSSQPIKSVTDRVQGSSLDIDQYEARSIAAATVNARGQVAFLNDLYGRDRDQEGNDPFGELGPVTGQALYATAPNGSVIRVLRTRDLFDVNDDPEIEDLREVRRISAGYSGFNATLGLESGSGTFFNDHGQLAFTASFADGTSGAFVVTVIPEPATGALLLSFAALAGLRRRKA